MKPWWSFDVADVLFSVVVLVAIYAIFGPPSGWAWLAVPVGLLTGRWVAWKLGWRRG